jgi:pimeloyl-ACP methyl ester carboxylesterase
MARTRKYVDINGHNWAYIEQGSSKKQKLFLIHGGFAYADFFNSVLTRIKKRYHVIIPDLPGFGFSKPLTPNTYKHIAQEFQGFVKHFGPDPALVFASSMGGAIVLASMQDAPQLFKYVLLQSPLWKQATIENQPVETIEKQLAKLPPQLLSFIQKPQIVRSAVKLVSWLSPDIRNLLTKKNQMVAEALHLLDIKGFQEFYNSIDSGTLAQDLNGVIFSVPLVLMAGTQINTGFPEQTAALATFLQKPLIHIPHEGHMIMLENPDKVVDLIDFSGYGMTWELPLTIVHN